MEQPMERPIAMTALNLLFLVVYVLSAMVQYNDPDPALWTAIYLAAAGMCCLEFRRQPPRWLPPALLVIALVWAGTLLPGIASQVTLREIWDSVAMKTQAVEEAREIGGLTLVALWAGVLCWRQRR